MFATKSYLSSANQTLLLLVVLSAQTSMTLAATPKKTTVNEKQVIGQTAIVEETESDFAFPARVDTGATTSSLHVEDWKIEDEADVMAENVGKTIYFRIKNSHGKSEWLKRKIAEISVIKTSEQEEQRYKVKMTLNCLDIKKRVLVSLNDRSHMTYPVLLGRNFLQGDFVVDVDLGRKGEFVKNQTAQLARKEKRSNSSENSDGDRPSPQGKESPPEAK